MYRKTIATAVAGLLILGLGACGNASDAKTADAGSTSQSQTTKKPAEKKPVEQPADLTGTWKQTNSGSTDSWMEAEITADTITVQWVSDNGDTKSLYWKGSYNAPDKAGDWKWTSQGDTAAMQASLLGSQDATKDFTYTKADRDGHHHSGEDRQAVNDATLTSWSKTLGVRVEERRLAGDRCGIYYDPLRLIIIDERLAGFQRRCTLCHELIHARHHDPGCGSQYGVKCERRCRRETALALISPVDYGMAEEIYEGAAWPMAVELGVTVQVLMDYRQLLHDSGVCMQ